MVKSKIAEIDGKSLTYTQLLDKESAEKAGCPKSQYFYWEYDGEKIFNPAQIIMMVQTSVVNGNFIGQKMLSKDSIDKHYSQLIEVQKKSAIDYLKDLKQSYIDGDYPKEAIESVDNSIKEYDKIGTENG